MSTKTTYKQTELGLIPDDWEVKKFAEFSKFYSGGTPLTSKSEYYNGQIPFIKSGEIYYDRTEQFLTQEGLDNSSAKLVNNGDLLYALYGANSGEVAISQIEGAINQAILCIQQNKDEAETIYLYNYLKLEKSTIINKYLQGGQGNLSADIIKNLFIPLPPLPEQKAIADCLSTWDVAIEKQSQLIERLAERKKALMQQLLTGKKRLPGFSGEWKKIEFKEVLKYEQPTKYLTNNFSELKSETPVLTANKSFILGYTEERENVFNKLPVIIFDDFTTASRFINFEFKVKSSAIKMLSLKNKNTSDLFFVFNLLQMIQTNISDHKRRWISEFEDRLIKLPSLSEQTAIAEILATADRELQLQKEKLAQWQTQKKGLMQALLTGKKRLIN